jgi:menaquinone-dependent protoporphyrinogen oxidase
MKRVLLVCSSTDGQTRRICDRLQRIIEDAGDAVTLVRIEDARDVSPAGFQMAVIGARIRYGRTDVRVIEYANRHAAALNAMPSAYFSVNIVARKPQKNRPETNPYVQAFLRRVAWRPPMLEVFAGKLDYPRYGALDRMIIRFIMWLTRGPTDPRAVVDFTDWQRVEAFAQALSAQVGIDRVEGRAATTAFRC